MKRLKEIGGPCRDRTYDQLIKRNHPEGHISPSFKWTLCVLGNLENALYERLRKRREARLINAYSIDDDQDYYSRDAVVARAEDTLILLLWWLAIVLFVAWVVGVLYDAL